MIFTIDIPTDSPYATFQSSLDGVLFAFDLLWNDRDALWYFNLSLPSATTAPTPILYGQAMVAQRPLLAGITHADRPAGELIIVGRDPGRYDWGTASKLLYFDAASVAEAVL